MRQELVLANVSVATNYGPWSTSFFANAVKSDGYRDNNALLYARANAHAADLPGLPVIATAPPSGFP